MGMTTKDEVQADAQKMSRGQKAVKRVREGKDKAKLTAWPCEVILVGDLRIGDRIGKVFGSGKYDEKVILKAEDVKEITECANKWRTHIHVNKMGCYDTRQPITVVAK